MALSERNQLGIQRSMDIIYLGYKYVDSLFNKGTGNLTVEKVEKIGWYGPETLSTGFNALNNTTNPANPPGTPSYFTAVGNRACSELQVSFEETFLRNVFGATKIRHYYPLGKHINAELVYVLSRVDVFNGDRLVAILRGSAQYRLDIDYKEGTVFMPVIDWINFYIQLPGVDGTFTNLEATPPLPRTPDEFDFPMCIELLENQVEDRKSKSKEHKSNDHKDHKKHDRKSCKHKRY